MAGKIISAVFGILLSFSLHTSALASVHNMAQYGEIYPSQAAETEADIENLNEDPTEDIPGYSMEEEEQAESAMDDESGGQIPSEGIDALPDPVVEEAVPRIVMSLPEIDVLDPAYISFKKDVHAIIDKAVKYSGIRTPVGVFVMDLTTNYYTGVNDTRTRIDPSDGMREGYFNSASVIKLFQGYILYDMMRHGELDENSVYTDPVTGWSFRLPSMIHTMIALSDNNYSNACMRLIGNAKSNEVLARLGITDSVIYGEMSGAIGYSLKNNLEKYGTSKRCARITPRDTGLILYNIYINKDTDPYMAALNKALLANIYNTRIPAGVKNVNKSYEVAHKTGTNTSLGIFNDAGIVYAKRPFILVALTQGTTSQAGHSFIRKLAQDLTLYFDNLERTGK